MDWEQILTEARILIVDDEQENVRLFEKILHKAGYRNVHSTTDSRQVLPMYLELRPDLILLDLSMPEMDGYEILKQLEPQIALETFVAVMVITGHTDAPHRLRALLAGATDFITKPFDNFELVLRVRIQLQIRFRFRELLQRLNQQG